MLEHPTATDGLGVETLALARCDSVVAVGRIGGVLALERGKLAQAADSGDVPFTGRWFHHERLRFFSSSVRDGGGVSGFSSGIHFLHGLRSAGGSPPFHSSDALPQAEAACQHFPLALR